MLNYIDLWLCLEDLYYVFFLFSINCKELKLNEILNNRKQYACKECTLIEFTRLSIYLLLLYLLLLLFCLSRLKIKALIIYKIFYLSQAIVITLDDFLLKNYLLLKKFSTQIKADTNLENNKEK